MQTTAYFIDFDFTISRGDVWDAIVKHCAPDLWQEVVAQYIRGEITSRQYNLRIAEIIQPDKEEITELVLSIGIDPTFPDFVQWATRRESPLTVVSDGYDFYIDLLLRAANLDFLPVFSNKMVWKKDGIDVEFPLYRADCPVDMAHCKCQHFEKFPLARHVYIGDGISDICAATKCETIYAKRNLLDHCVQNEIPHTSFENYHQIIQAEEALLVGTL
ncbi:MAG: MtnX-like HAD-IB family phosphatase [bacterium]|jgi:2,3-diketo-5-methylthio-1-phosphopentane phosphatase|nr:MtnX-like HAD-IB family phosphatase [bacterium]